MAISTLQGTCAAVEYVLEGQIHLPLCYVKFCTFYSAVCRLEKGERNKLSQKLMVVIKDGLGILKWLIDARLEQSTNIQTNQAVILQIFSLKSDITKLRFHYCISLWLSSSKFKLMGLESSLSYTTINLY